ncbi:MAG TPA: hypothetical protein VM842_04155 [Nitrospira sp.]|jgi:hypothetical protein|nr:hypothetical protein [Nitrospira sp.]
MSPQDDDKNRIVDLAEARLFRALRVFSISDLRQLAAELEEVEGSNARHYPSEALGRWINNLRNDADEAAVICRSTADPGKRDLYQRLHDHMCQLADEVEQVKEEIILGSSRQRLLSDREYTRYLADSQMDLMWNAIDAAFS